MQLIEVIRARHFVLLVLRVTGAIYDHDMHYAEEIQYTDANQTLTYCMHNRFDLGLLSTQDFFYQTNCLL